jgi:hypothetical protein
MRSTATSRCWPLPDLPGVIDVVVEQLVLDRLFVLTSQAEADLGGPKPDIANK